MAHHSCNYLLVIGISLWVHIFLQNHLFLPLSFSFFSHINSKGFSHRFKIYFSYGILIFSVIPYFLLIYYICFLFLWSLFFLFFHPFLGILLQKNVTKNVYGHFFFCDLHYGIHFFHVSAWLTLTFLTQ